jgi:hypothetical protein
LCLCRAHCGGTGRQAARPTQARPGAAARSAVVLTSEGQHAIADAASKQAKAALRRVKTDSTMTKTNDTDAPDTTKPSGTKVARRRTRSKQCL